MKVEIDGYVEACTLCMWAVAYGCIGTGYGCVGDPAPVDEHVKECRDHRLAVAHAQFDRMAELINGCPDECRDDFEYGNSDGCVAFTSRPCEVCGDALAGSRYHLAVLR